MSEKRALTDPPSLSQGRPKKQRTDPNGIKYYAVRAGKTPGVYLTWADCQAQTAGYRGAMCECGPISIRISSARTHAAL
jgi:ribonuclease HI